MPEILGHFTMDAHVNRMSGQDDPPTKKKIGEADVTMQLPFTEVKGVYADCTIDDLDLQTVKDIYYNSEATNVLLPFKNFFGGLDAISGVGDSQWLVIGQPEQTSDEYAIVGMGAAYTYIYAAVHSTHRSLDISNKTSHDCYYFLMCKNNKENGVSLIWVLIRGDKLYLWEIGDGTKNSDKEDIDFNGITVSYSKDDGGDPIPMPDSLIPLKSTLYTGVDYKSNIDVYDETQKYAKNMFLENFVGRIPYKYIDYQSPDGKILVDTSLQFTHFIGTSFTDSNTPRVYRITSHRPLGNNLIEYSFTIDYLKDYFQHYGITTFNNPIVRRTTDSSKWNKFISDIALTTGEYKIDGWNLNDTFGTNVLITLADGHAYTFPYSSYNTFMSNYMSQANNTKLSGFIRGIYLIPDIINNASLTGYSVTSVNEIVFYNEDGTDLTVPMSCYRIIQNGNTTSFADFKLNGSWSDIATNWLEKDSDFKMHIPFYGDISVTNEIIEVLKDTSARIRYIIDYMDGKCFPVFLSNYGSTAFIPQPFAPLPQLPVPSNAEVSLIQNASNQAVTNITGTMVSGLFNPIESGIKAGIQYSQYENQEQNIKNTSGIQAVGGSGFSSIIVERLYMSRTRPLLTTSLEDYYDLVGYPCNRRWSEVGGVSGKTYWLDFTNVAMKGSKEYAERAREAISQGVIYNY